MLKADVAAHFSGSCFIGLPGVNCPNGFAPLLNIMGVISVYEVLDMDKFTNKNVATAAYNLRCKLSEAVFAVFPVFGIFGINE